MTEISNPIDWSKYNFTYNELADPATGIVRLAPGFLDTLQALREIYGRPLVVTGGCRSSEHNQWLLDRGYPASPNSFHLIDNPKYQTGGCCAVDVARPNGTDLHDLIHDALDKAWSVGVAKTFIHLDRRVDYTTLLPRLYTY